MNTPEPNENKLTPEEEKFERDMLELKLKAEFGMLNSMSHAELPADLERMFLQQVYDFEKNYAGKEEAKPISETLKYPDFEPWPKEGLPWEQGENRVQDLLNWYREGNIEVVFQYEYPPAVKYEFLTQLLPQQPNYYGDNIQINTVVCYEEYFQNHGAEIEEQTRAFMEHFFNKNAEGFMDVLWRDQIAPETGPYDGILLLDYLEKWFAGISDFEEHKYIIIETSYEFFEGEEDDASGSIEFKDNPSENYPHGMGYAAGLVGYRANSLMQAEPLEVTGPFKLYFEWREGRWAIIYPVFPELSVPPNV